MNSENPFLKTAQYMYNLPFNKQVEYAQWLRTQASTPQQYDAFIAYYKQYSAHLQQQQQQALFSSLSPTASQPLPQQQQQQQQHQQQQPSVQSPQHYHYQQQQQQQHYAAANNHAYPAASNSGSGAANGYMFHSLANQPPTPPSSTTPSTTPPPPLPARTVGSGTQSPAGFTTTAAPSPPHSAPTNYNTQYYPTQHQSTALSPPVTGAPMTTMAQPYGRQPMASPAHSTPATATAVATDDSDDFGDFASAVPTQPLKQQQPQQPPQYQQQHPQQPFQQQQQQQQHPQQPLQQQQHPYQYHQQPLPQQYQQPAGYTQQQQQQQQRSQQPLTGYPQYNYSASSVGAPPHPNLNPNQQQQQRLSPHQPQPQPQPQPQTLSGVNTTTASNTGSPAASVSPASSVSASPVPAPNAKLAANLDTMLSQSWSVFHGDFGGPRKANTPTTATPTPPPLQSPLSQPQPQPLPQPLPQQTAQSPVPVSELTSISAPVTSQQQPTIVNDDDDNDDDWSGFQAATPTHQQQPVAEAEAAGTTGPHQPTSSSSLLLDWDSPQTTTVPTQAAATTPPAPVPLPPIVPPPVVAVATLQTSTAAPAAAPIIAEPQKDTSAAIMNLFDTTTAPIGSGGSGGIAQSDDDDDDFADFQQATVSPVQPTLRSPTPPLKTTIAGGDSQQPQPQQPQSLFSFDDVMFTAPQPSDTTIAAAATLSPAPAPAPAFDVHLTEPQSTLTATYDSKAKPTANADVDDDEDFADFTSAAPAPVTEAVVTPMEQQPSPQSTVQDVPKATTPRAQSPATAESPAATTTAPERSLLERFYSLALRCSDADALQRSAADIETELQSIAAAAAAAASDADSQYQSSAAFRIFAHKFRAIQESSQRLQTNEHSILMMMQSTDAQLPIAMLSYDATLRQLFQSERFRELRHVVLHYGAATTTSAAAFVGSNQRIDTLRFDQLLTLLFAVSGAQKQKPTQHRLRVLRFAASQLPFYRYLSNQFHGTGNESRSGGYSQPQARVTLEDVDAAIAWKAAQLRDAKHILMMHTSEAAASPLRLLMECLRHIQSAYRFSLAMRQSPTLPKQLATAPALKTFLFAIRKLYFVARNCIKAIQSDINQSVADEADEAVRPLREQLAAKASEVLTSLDEKMSFVYFDIKEELLSQLDAESHSGIDFCTCDLCSSVANKQQSNSGDVEQPDIKTDDWVLTCGTVRRLWSAIQSETAQLERSIRAPPEETTPTKPASQSPLTAPKSEVGSTLSSDWHSLLLSNPPASTATAPATITQPIAAPKPKPQSPPPAVSPLPPPIATKAIEPVSNKQKTSLQKQPRVTGAPAALPRIGGTGSGGVSLLGAVPQPKRSIARPK